MPATSLVQIFTYIGVVVLLAFPLGGYMAKVFSGELTFADRVLKQLSFF